MKAPGRNPGADSVEFIGRNATLNTIMTAPPPPRAHGGDSDPDPDEALRRVREKRSEVPQLPSVPGLCVRRHVRGVVARMTASAITLGAERELVGKQIRCHIEKGCTCGPNDKCRHPHPVPPQTAASANDGGSDLGMAREPLQVRAGGGR